MHIDQLLLHLRVSGFAIINRVIPPEECETIEGRILVTAEKEASRYSGQKHVSLVSGLINYEQSFAPYLADERIMALAESLLGPHVRISFTSAIVNRIGLERGGWHADWPFNQKNAGHVPQPYPDAIMHITTLWMISPFTVENGGTLILPGSHRAAINPTDEIGVDPMAPFPGEMQATGEAGDVLMLDSRLWHATPPNLTDQPRIAMAVRYAPWWLNCEVVRPESDERKRMVDEPGSRDNVVPSIPRDVFDILPERTKPLYRHWVID